MASPFFLPVFNYLPSLMATLGVHVRADLIEIVIRAISLAVTRGKELG
jgi:hypothetical protein